MEWQRKKQLNNRKEKSIMYRIRIHLEGIAPLRMNRFTQDGLSGTSKKITDEERKEEAEDRTYKDSKGYYIEARAIKKCIMNGGKKVKVGRGSASKLIGAIFIMDEQVVYLPKKYKSKLVSGVVRIPPGPGNPRVLKYWKQFDKWDIQFTATVVDSRVPLESIKSSIYEAGVYEGLLDGRPDCGRFLLKKIEKI